MAMMREEYGERTFEPTPLRLQEARRRGQVAVSRDLSAAALLLAAAMGLWLVGGPLLDATTSMTASLLDAPSGAVTLAGLGGELWRGVSPILAAVAPLVLLLMLIAVLAGVAQTGLLVASEALRWDFSRVSPVAGAARLLSLRSLVGTGLAVGKLAAVAVIATLTIRGRLGRIAGAGALDPRGLLAEAGTAVCVLAIRVALALLVLGVADYAYRRWRLRQELKMTRREWMEDIRRMETNPEMRRRHREWLRKVRSVGARPREVSDA